MRDSKNSLLRRLMRRFLRGESGQVAAVMAVTVVAIMALSAAGIETGHVYYAYRLLQASTNASALAAGQAMPDIGSAGSNASGGTQAVSPTSGTAYYNMVEYSSAAQWGMTGLNATNMLQNDTISATFSCSSKVTGSFNLGCQTNIGSGSECTGSGSTSGCNTITVTQKAHVNLWFGGLDGIKTFNLQAVSEASMRGGSDTPYNIAVIIDTTGSMSSDQAPSKDDCPGGDNQIECAVYGLETMLELMDPCALNTTCSSSTTYVDDVALFVFPAVSANDQGTDDFAKDDYCSRNGPTSVPYAFPNVAGTGTGTTTPTSTDLTLPISLTSYPNNAGYYELIPFNNSYKTNDTTQSLNTTTSPGEYLAQAVGYSGSGCKGLIAEGGQGTYYAQAIYAAQSALTGFANATPGSVNVMIVLSDGDATACSAQGNYGSWRHAPSCGGSQSDIVALNCPNNDYGGSDCTGNPLNGTSNGPCPRGSTCTTNPYPNSYQYPSALGECWQAVQAAQWATSQGTRVYTIAMGSETGAPNGGSDGSGSGNGSCLSDQVSETALTSSTGGLTYPSSAYSGKSGSACNAIGAMATSSNMFFSDEASSPACTATGGNVNFTSIPGIFQAIAASLTDSRLIPNGT